MNRICSIVASLLLMLLAMPGLANDAIGVQVHPSKKIGYSLGDILEQRITLEQGGKRIAIQQFPPLQREGQWLERLSVSVNRQSNWLEIKYQVVNIPAKVVETALPELELALTDGGAMSVVSWPFSISPALPAVAEATDVLPAVQANTPPTASNTNQILQHLTGIAAALVVAALAWLAWWQWQNWSDSKNLPFAQAYTKLRSGPKATVNKDEDSWIALHRAFDRTAGRTISTGTLPECLHQAPWLNSLETQINEFYTASTKRFFDWQVSEQHNNPVSLDLLALSKQLHIAEKNHVSGIKAQRIRSRSS